MIRYLKKIYYNIFPPNHSPLRYGKKTNFVFIHINKTGGTSIAKNLGFFSKRHYSVREVQKIIGFDWHDAFTFTVVRNPYDRIVSQFEHARMNNHSNIRTNNISFNNWVKFTYDEKRKEFRKAGEKFFYTQKEWLQNEFEKIDIDYIIKFENLIEDYKIVQDIIGIKKKLTHLNSTIREPFQNYYNVESKKIIEDYFKADFEEFNYPYKNFDFV